MYISPPDLPGIIFIEHVFVFSTYSRATLSHLGIRECGVAVLRVKLQRDEGDFRDDPGHHGLHSLVLGDAHVLKSSRQENNPVCGRGKNLIYFS